MGRNELPWDVSPTFWDRYWAKVSKSEDCWLWLGASHDDGYGHIKAGVGGRVLLAHRVAYVAFVGPLLPGMLVCHRCDTPACVRPEHLFLGDHATNAQDRNSKGRSASQRVTACPSGHAYDEENTGVNVEGKRFCRQCAREASRRWRSRRSAHNA